MDEALKDRLERLYEAVCQVPPEHFDQSRWGVRTPCGTVGCTLGWAAMTGALAPEGVTVEWSPRDVLGEQRLDFVLNGERNALFKVAALFPKSLSGFLFDTYLGRHTGEVGKAWSMARIAWAARGGTVSEWKVMPPDEKRAKFEEQRKKIRENANIAALAAIPPL